ncbi:hypothetical protein [Tenacibaculum soleae]
MMISTVTVHFEATIKTNGNDLTNANFNLAQKYHQLTPKIAIEIHI